MKKILILTVAFIMTFSFTVSAANIGDFEKVLENGISYADIKITESFETIKASPELLEELIGDTKNIDFTSVYDISLHIENGTINYNEKKETKYKNYPEINNGPDEYYAIIDSGEEKMSYINILKANGQSDYEYFHISEIPYYSVVCDELEEAILNGTIKDAFKSFKMGEVKVGRYVITMSDEEAKNALLGFLKGISPAVNASPDYSGIGLEYDAEELYNTFRDIKILGEKGATIAVELDGNNNLKKAEIIFNIDTNLYDDNLVAAEDNKNKSLWDLKATYKITAEFSNVNVRSGVNYPLFDESNTVNYTGDLIQEYFYDTMQYGIPNIYFKNYKVYFEDVAPTVENGRTLVPLRKFLNAMGIADEDIIYDEGYITIKWGNNKIVKLNIFDNNASVTENGVEKPVTLDVSAKLYNDRTLVPLRFIGEAFDYQVQYVEIDSDTSFINIYEK